MRSVRLASKGKVTRSASMRPGRSMLVGVLVAASIALVGCGSSTTGSAGSTTTSSGPPRSTATPSTIPAATHVLVATFADNGGTLTVSVHDRLRVVLAGPSWALSSSNRSILVTSGRAAVLPATASCVPGQGCGSVTRFFTMVRPGTAKVLGSRARCDHAVTTCTTGPKAFQLRVVVLP